MFYGSHPQSILTYQGRIVAVEDLIYDILCFCHLASEHGDQDATNALIQDNYAFVPFALVRYFVGSCPSCVEKSLKKAMDVMPAQGNRMVDEQKPGPMRADSTLVNDTPSNSASASRSSIPLLSPETSKSKVPVAITIDIVDETGREKEEEDFVRYLHLERTLRNPVTKVKLPLMATRSSPGFRPPSTSSPGAIERVTSLPMSREVSLYQGIPNGWQYHFPDYESALNEFVKQKDDSLILPSEGVSKKRDAVPRVPSIAPLRGDKIHNTLGNGRELFDHEPPSFRKRETVQETPKDDLLSLALAQIEKFSVSFEGCKVRVLACYADWGCLL
ncbi:hypothetical protein E1B28_013390 [Marasmius oreades]|uniref:Uncharacterized protein n=1 Tax=Marasmius oreades TaxID=181124 RepID=A0A9P7UM37_9AGAR|nr:uncharacterized protein E1B28_013390 [Marasmius oreades]KAG7087422.1 hypothetical protein E1B28_013390 [Marasmius oreades]